MEIFTGAVASIAALFTAMIGLLKLPVFSFMEHTRHKKMTQLLNTKEVISLFDNYETNFKDSFNLIDGYNSAGYNENGFNRAGEWDAAYDDIDDVSYA